MSELLRDAATVLVLRDGRQGLEVLMGRRSRGLAFSAGAYVFPGGAVDAADASAPVRLRAHSPDALERRFGEAGPLRYYAAALREVFEESGLWLGPPTDADLPALRAALLGGDLDPSALFEQFGPCDLDGLHYFAFWTTPPVSRRRYRTRFFACRAPEGQPISPDGYELLDVEWVRPERMLARHEAGEVSLIFPTFKHLQTLSRFGQAAAALQALAAIDPVREVRTRHRLVDGRTVEVLMPGEPGYEDLPAW